MDEKKQQLLSEIRYTVRLCQRQARYYRRLQAIGLFASIIGGSAMFANLTTLFPSWVPIMGGIVFVSMSAALMAIRPADKAAINEADMKRYQALKAKAETMDSSQIAVALEDARTGDCPEIDALRNVAYNDIMKEINREDQSIKLTPTEKIYDLFA